MISHVLGDGTVVLFIMKRRAVFFKIFAKTCLKRMMRRWRKMTTHFLETFDAELIEQQFKAKD